MSDFDFAETDAVGPHPYEPPYTDAPLTVEALNDIFADCGDFQSRLLKVGLGEALSVTAVWLDGIVSGGDVSEDIMRPLTESARFSQVKASEECVELAMCGGIYSNSPIKRDTTSDVADDIAHGWCALIFDDIKTAICFEVRTSNVRGIGEPSLEKSVKGAKDSFVETLRINTSLVRRRISTPKLKLKNVVIGRKSLTRCAVMYVDGVADPQIVDELIRRLNAIDIDGALASGAIESYIVDSPKSSFPQVIHTERPDRFSLQLLEGRVGLIVDGQSIGFMVPVSLPEFMRVLQDRTNSYIITGIMSMLRYLALFLSLALPAIYTAIAMYHQEMIPTMLLLSIVQAKQNVPFSVVVEILTMLIAFNLLQEADLRLPGPVGNTVSIIGGLIVGQSAVEAKIVSPIAVIVVALAGICSYTIPSQDMGAAVRVWRTVLVLAGVAAGLYGVVAGLCLMTLYLCNIESFGVNYMSPISSGKPGGLAKAVWRVPIEDNKFREPSLRTPDRRRQK